MPPDEVSRELKFDGKSSSASGHTKRKAQSPGAARMSAQLVPAKEPSDDLQAPSVALPPCDRADHNGQGGMATRGRLSKGATSVQPSEQPGVVPVASRTEEVVL